MNHKSIYPFLLCITLALPVFFALHADFNRSNTLRINRLISYKPDSSGLYIKEAPQLVENVPEDAEVLAKCNKLNSIYLLLNGYSLYRVDLSKNSYKRYKKNDEIQLLDEQEFNEYPFYLDEEIKRHYDSRNELRRKFITDSIKEVEKEAEWRKHLIDSLDNDAKLKALEKALDDYKSFTNPYLMPNGDEKLPPQKRIVKCAVPGCSYFTNDDFLFVYKLNRDSLIFASIEKKKNNEISTTYHTNKLPPHLIGSNVVKIHLKVYGDSIKLENGSFREITDVLNGYNSYKALTKSAPYGYIEEWGWDMSYGNVSFNIQYANTNRKTIKYLKIYFSILNDVDDVRGSGIVEGTGPIKQDYSAKWDWDRTNCYVYAGDATKMRITKLVITYMDGTTKTLTGKSIVYAPSSE